MMNKNIKYIDCHTHILPNIDDGSRSPQESVLMLESLKSQGVETIWLTPHYYSYKEPMEDFLKKRDESYSVLINYAQQLNINLIKGSETYLTDYLFNNSDISKLCINEKNYLLTELPYSTSFSNRTFNRLYRLIGTYNVVPILAHIERYSKIMKTPKILEELIDLGCLAQINLSCLSNGILQRAKIIKFIKQGLINFVGTDCHNIETRPPDYIKGIMTIEKKLGSDCIRELIENSKLISNYKS